MKRLLFLLLALSLAGLVPAADPASGPFPPQDAAAILASVDARSGGSQAPKDMKSTMVMTMVQGGSTKVRQIMAWSRINKDKDDDRLMKFLAPADVRDVGFLVLGDATMYIYLPEFHRTRRIASSNRKDAFMSSDFSYEDLGTGEFAKSYDPVLKEERPEAWILELRRKPGADKTYPRIVMTVDKARSLAVKTELYDEGGRLWKTAEQTPVQVQSYWIATRIKMTDHKRGSSTLLEMKDLKVDLGLGDDLFTERNLVRKVQE
jgi:outer membrane lipoprotein-sorting protein